MKISIDTKEDSNDEIKRVITLLNHLIGENMAIENASPEQASESGQQAEQGFFNLFNDTPTNEPPAQPAPEPSVPIPEPAPSLSAEEPVTDIDNVYRVSQEEKKVDFSDEVVPYE